ncbi:protein PF14_0175-like, partial [Melanaphis sacchari]|uniref:protein PF14_0175-like n=1 Tax=Melanaphis sacchari TaxID=742174 RepID=UPI000DC130F8
MEDAEESPRDEGQPSQNDDPVPEEDQHYFDKLLLHLWSFLPFLTKVIDSSELLKIQPDQVPKLQYLYQLVDAKRLSPDRLKICKKVFHDLYDRYSSQLNYYLPPDFKTSWLKETKLNDNEHKVSSEVKCSFIKSNQNQNRKSELSNNISVPSTNHDKMVNNQPDSLEDLTSKNENTIDKSSKNIIISESSSSKNLLDDNSPKKNLPEFSDSRLRLNKVIGFAANASIEKLNKSDASIPRAELTTQIFNDIVKQKNNPVLYKDMLKGINMDDIDVNYVKEVIEGIKKASCVEPVQPPPLPPSDLMDLGTSTINLISTTEQNPHKIVTPDNILSSKSTSINRPPSDTELNTLHKTGSSNDTSQKFISALKPGTLIDLVNSKVSRTSLHIESLRPVIKANGKSNDNKISVADINVPRDPRIRNKSLLSSENSISPINTHASLVQTAFSTNSPHLFASNIDNSNSIFETKAQEISGYNGLSLPNHTNNQLLNLPFPSEHNVGGSILFKNRPLSQNQNRQNRNDFNQFSNSSQIHVTPSHSEPMVKYCDPVPYKSHSNDTISKRDPRSFKNIPVTNRVQFPNYKEYREAKYGKEQNKSFEKNKQMNQVHEKIEKNNIIDSSYNTFGIVNETANIKGFKIPKIKHNGDLVDNSSVKDSKTKVVESNKNNADILNTEKIVKVPKKTNHFYHALKQCTVDGQKTEIIKSNDSKKDTKKTEKINNSHTDKNMEIKITENSNTDRNLQMKTAVINKPDKDESCPDINLEKITVNIPSKVDDKDKLPKFEQNDNLIEPTKHNKPKKPKKYSKEKEFEKIVKEAVENSYNDACGPRTRTRCSLLKNKETLKTSKVNNSKPMFEKKSSSKNNKKLEFGECSKNLDDNLSIPSMIDVSESVEIGHNIISSTSKEQSEVVNSTTNEILCKSQEENIVSSNEINSTADNPKINEKVLIDILKNPKFMTVISLFQDENKLEKLNKLLESSIVGSNDDKLNKNISNEEQLDIDRQKKIKRKMKKEKKKQRKMKKILGEESSNEESLNDISDDNNFNQAENIVITKKKKNMNELDEGNTNSGNILGYSSTEQHKLKSVKRKISNESYGNFEILKDKCKPELKDLKIVIAKFDKNIKRKENCSSDITSTSNDRLTNNEPINVVKAQKIKPKKPFLGPLSVKLARQKMEIKQNNSKKSLNNKNQFNFKTKTSEKGFSSFSSDYKKNGKLLTDTLNSMMNEQPVVILHPLINPEAYDEVVFNKSVVQNPNTSTVIEPNVNVNKPELKKARLSELDKLHADISEMFDCDAVLNASNIRQCRTNKQIDYVNTSVAPSKKKKASNIEQLDCNDDQNKLICGIEKPKNTKKKVKKSTLKLNTKNKCVKESMANKTLPSIIVKTAVSKKVSDKEPSKLKKKKKENKKSKKSNNQLNNFINNVVLNDESELNNLSSNKISTEVMPKVLSENEFKDKSYFQTTDNILECKFCNYKDKGLNIVRHYKDQHRGEEVLPSRLPKNCTELLIHQSIKENFGHQNSQDSKPFCLGSVNVNYTCVFCQVIFHDYFKFHDHITGHTGEYRFKCKMCDQIYSNEDELDKHILEHTDYDKTNGISHLIYPNPMWSKIVFGYLCSFCYYVQLNYKNMVKHMTSRHFYEDKKLNGHWTVIRISMSMADKNYIDSLINLNNLVGCLPPTQADQVISKYNDNEDQNQQLTVRDINILPKEQMQLDSVLSIKKESNRQNINAIPPVSIIDENSSELSIFENPPDLTIENNSAKLTVVETPSESNVDENLPKERIQLDTILSIK